MKQENNTPENLRKLWRNNLITSQEYFFRLQANKLKINTHLLLEALLYQWK